jgi:large repetitive protein
MATDPSTGVSLTFSFSLRVSNIAITTPQILPIVGVVGSPINYAFQAAGGGTKTWSTPGLPGFSNGFLSLSSTGILTSSGTLTAGAFTFLVSVTDGTFADQRRFTLFIRQPNPTILSVAATAVADVAVGQAMWASLTASGGLPPYTWSVAPGSMLPPGVSLMAASDMGTPSPSQAGVAAGGSAIIPGTSILFGAPSVAGPYAFDLVVADNAGSQSRRTFTLNVTTVNILPGAPRTVTADVPYAEQFTAVGGTPPYTFSMSPVSPTRDMLPGDGGLTLTPDGRIAGTTASTGTYAFFLKVEDATGNTFTRRYGNLNVTNSAGWMVTSTNPIDSPVGTTHSHEDLKTNGPSTHAWSMAPGSTLPPGVALLTGPPFASPNSPALAGQPTMPGTYTYTLRATDTVAPFSFADHTFTFRVAPMQMVSPPV